MWSSRITVPILFQLHVQANCWMIKVYHRIPRQVCNKTIRPTHAEEHTNFIIPLTTGGVKNVAVNTTDYVSPRKSPMSLLFFRAPHIEKLDLVLVPVSVHRDDRHALREQLLLAGAIRLQDPLWLHRRHTIVICSPDCAVVCLLHALEDLDLALAMELQISQGKEDVTLFRHHRWYDHDLRTDLVRVLLSMLICPLMNLSDDRLDGLMNRQQLFISTDNHWRRWLVGSTEKPPQVPVHVLQEESNFFQEDTYRLRLHDGRPGRLHGLDGPCPQAWGTSLC
mmetsp:Transcript_32913/g.83369  ORF Transcript_32913/g.83369 Transcript_32913/m.83369 type:complete len:280 (-) Transcript_32913:48-887(-)